MSRAALAAEGMTLDPGQSVRIVCPFCGGGSSGERCMSLKLDEATGLLLYHCFRGNCGESGVIGNGAPNLVRTSKRFVPYDTRSLVDGFTPSGWEALDAWGLPASAVIPAGWCTDHDKGRMAIPVRGPHYELRGYVLRATDGRTPKVLTGRILDDCPFQSWEFTGSPVANQSLIIVEDIPSATRLRLRGRDALALLGNTPSDAALDEIRVICKARGRTPYFALDPDATAQAIKLSRVYGLRGECAVLVLSKDFKNMTDKEIDDCLTNVH